MATTTSTSYLLEGTQDLVVEEDKLPSNGQVLRFINFHYEKNKQTETVRGICRKVVPILHIIIRFVYFVSVLWTEMKTHYCF